MKRSVNVLFFLLLIPLQGLAVDKIVIGTGLKPPLVSSEYSPGFLDSLAAEAFSRMGIELEVIILPAERALINANKGIEDGNLLRIKGLEKNYPNLVRVPEKMMDSEFVGYSFDPVPGGPGWERLQGRNVTYVKGWKIFESNVRDAAAIQAVGNPSQMFALLKEGRVEVALYERWQGILLAGQAGLTDYRVLEPPFVTKEMFMYLNKKHKALVPLLANTLKKMKEDGSYERIFRETLGKLQR